MHLEIAGAAMRIAAQVDRHDLIGQAFEVQRDAQAVRGTAAEERVELHGDGRSLASAVQSAAPTLSAISPTPSMRPTMRSPGTTAPTPSGVPVKIRSPDC